MKTTHSTTKALVMMSVAVFATTALAAPNIGPGFSRPKALTQLLLSVKVLDGDIAALNNDLSGHVVTAKAIESKLSTVADKSSLAPAVAELRVAAAKTARDYQKADEAAVSLTSQLVDVLEIATVEGDIATVLKVRSALNTVKGQRRTIAKSMDSVDHLFEMISKLEEATQQDNSGAAA